MFRSKVTLLALMFGFSVFISTVLISKAQDNKATLRVRGATTVASMIQPWIQEFEAKNAGLQVVVYGSTHGDGLKSLGDGSADMAMTARELSNDERRDLEQKGMRVAEDKICNDALAIIVNHENPVNELSLDQLKGVFGGLFTNWRDVGGSDAPILVVTLPEDSGMASFLSRDVLKVPFASNAVVERAPREVVPLVRGRKGGISFCRTDLAIKESRSSKPIRILAIKKNNASEAVALTKETVANGTFPLMRPLGFCYDSSKNSGAAKLFSEFCGMKYKETSQ